MKRLELGGWCIEFDADGTRAAFSDRPAGFPEECGCPHCLNFIAVRSQAYPEETVSFLATLGLEVDREEHVAWIGPAESGLQLYSGWFRFIGRLCSIHDGEQVADPGNMTRMGANFEFFLVPGGEISGQRAIQLEFSCEVPWVRNGAPLDE